MEIRSVFLSVSLLHEKKRCLYVFLFLFPPPSRERARAHPRARAYDSAPCVLPDRSQGTHARARSRPTRLDPSSDPLPFAGARRAAALPQLAQAPGRRTGRRPHHAPLRGQAQGRVGRRRRPGARAPPGPPPAAVVMTARRGGGRSRGGAHCRPSWYSLSVLSVLACRA